MDDSEKVPKRQEMRRGQKEIIERHNMILEGNKLLHSTVEDSQLEAFRIYNQAFSMGRYRTDEIYNEAFQKIDFGRLLELLSNATVPVKLKSLGYLQGTGGLVTFNAVKSFLDDSNTEIVMAALRVLKSIGPDISSLAISKLAELILDHPEVGVRESACELIFKLPPIEIEKEAEQLCRAIAKKPGPSYLIATSLIEKMKGLKSDWEMQCLFNRVLGPGPADEYLRWIGEAGRPIRLAVNHTKAASQFFKQRADKDSQDIAGHCKDNLWPLTELQQKIWDALENTAFKKEALAKEVGCDASYFYKPGGINEMRDAKVVLNKRGLGYYRPDAPPSGPSVKKL